MFRGAPWWPTYAHFRNVYPHQRVFVNIAWRGRNMHFPRRATHSTWIGVRSAEYMLGKSGCPCTKTKVENTFFAIFQVGEVPISIGFNHFYTFQKKLLKIEGRVVFLIFFNSSAVSRGKPIPTHHGKRDNKKVKIAIVEGSRFVHSGHFTPTTNIGNVEHGIK